MNNTARRDADLIGKSGSRYRITTPALVLDLDRLEANIAKMQAFCRDRQIGLRPHAKSNKCIAIAQAQIEAGALGICCATLGEAEILAGAGIVGVMITSPVVGDRKIARLSSLNRHSQDLMVVVDNPNNIRRLNEAAQESGEALRVLIDLDVGQRRTGATSPAAAMALAQDIADASHLSCAGVQAYAGHLQHVAGYDERRSAAREAVGGLHDVISALTEGGFPPDIVTGVGTGTYDIDPAANVYTEIQPGSYVFMDVEYADPNLWRDARVPFDGALFVQTTVLSVNIAGQATTDGGLKAFATDGPVPIPTSGVPAGASYKFTGDEFGCVELPGSARLELGGVVECMVPHCDPTVNLYDRYHCVRGDVLVDIWTIDCRGRY